MPQAFIMQAIVLLFYCFWRLSYENYLFVIYRKHHFSHIWFDRNGIIEFGNSLHSKVKELENEGVSAKFPYQEKIAGVLKMFMVCISAWQVL